MECATLLGMQQACRSSRNGAGLFAMSHAQTRAGHQVQKREPLLRKIILQAGIVTRRRPCPLP
jgi:hypothetical protein